MGGWLAGEVEIKAISAFNWVEVEVKVEAEPRYVWYLLQWVFASIPGGWVAGEVEIKAISAFNWIEVEVEVEAELGKKALVPQLLNRDTLTSTFQLIVIILSVNRCNMSEKKG